MEHTSHTKTRRDEAQPRRVMAGTSHMLSDVTIVTIPRSQQERGTQHDGRDVTVRGWWFDVTWMACDGVRMIWGFLAAIGTMGGMRASM